MFSCEFENTAQNPEIKIKNEQLFYAKEVTSEEEEEYGNNGTEGKDKVADQYNTHGSCQWNPRLRQQQYSQQSNLLPPKQNTFASCFVNWRSNPNTNIHARTHTRMDNPLGVTSAKHQNQNSSKKSLVWRVPTGEKKFGYTTQTPQNHSNLANSNKNKFQLQ